MIGWHWLAEDRRLQYGTREVVEANQTYIAIGPLMCRNGMHASRRALDALKYAPGPVICRVELSGEIVHDTDKSVARTRRVLWLADATEILHEFALDVATQALEAYGDPVDPRSWAALEVKRRWLHGEATAAELAAARAAAGAAADAAWAAADAARAAAWAAARAAAWAAADAARAAAWAAARAAWAAAGAAWDAARAAAWAAQNRQLEIMLSSLAPDVPPERRGR